MVPSSSPTSDLPTGVRQHLASLGVSDDLVVKVRDSHGFTINAESSLTTLATVASRQRVRTLLLGNPGLLCVPLGIWLDFLTAYGMSRHGFYSLLSTHPELFTTGSLFRAGSVIAYLQSLGLSPRDVVASIIPRCAQVLLQDVPSRLMPVVTFLVRDLGLGQDELAGLLTRCPLVLLHDPATDLAPRLGALLAAGFEPHVARRAICDDASLLVGDVSGVLSRQKGFLVSECGFSGAQALQVLAGCPSALSLTLPNMARKWRFLRDRMGCGREEVLAYPQFWSKNLLLEVGPRYAYVTERLKLGGWEEEGTAGGQDGSAGPMPAGSPPRTRRSLTLSVLLDCNDAVFVSRVWRRGAAAALFGSSGAGGGGDDDDDDGGGGGGGGGGSGSGSGSGSTRGSGARACVEGGSGGARDGDATEGPVVAAAALAAGMTHGMYDIDGGCGVVHQGAEPAAAAPEPAGAVAATLTAASTGMGPGADVNTSPSANANPGPSIDPGRDPSTGSTADGDAGGLPAAALGPYLADYRDFRAAWLEREGAKWTGVRSSTGSAPVGSW